MQNRYVLPRLRRYHVLSNPFQVITLLVSQHYGITIAELNNPTNSHKYSKRRHLLMTVLSRHSFIPHITIAHFFGYHNHCMVTHANYFVSDMEYIFKKNSSVDYYLYEFRELEKKFLSLFSKSELPNQ